MKKLVSGKHPVSRDVIARFDIDGVLFEIVPSAAKIESPRGGNARLCLQVESVEDSLRQLKSKKVHTGHAENKGAGVLGSFEDPDGNEICLWQYLQADAARTRSVPLEREAGDKKMTVPAEQPRIPSASSIFNWAPFCKAAGIAAFVFLVYCLATMVQMTVLGGPPATVEEAFRMLQQNRVLGLLRLDFPTVLVLPLYYLLFFGILAALRNTNRTHAAIGTVLVFLGVTLVLAMPTALPLMALSDKYATATSEAMRAHFLAAGEAVLATDIWHGTGAYIGGIFVQSGAVWISVVMLRGGAFNKAIAYLGILTHGLDLVHIVFVPFLPKVATLFMIVAGLGYPVWLWLVGRRLLQVGKAEHAG